MGGYNLLSINSLTTKVLGGLKDGIIRILGQGITYTQSIMLYRFHAMFIQNREKKIMSLNPYDATVICGWELKRVKLACARSEGGVACSPITVMLANHGYL